MVRRTGCKGQTHAATRSARAWTMLTVAALLVAEQSEFSRSILSSMRNSDYFECNSPVMVWSAGPDKMIDPTSPATKGANKDNVLSWK